MTIQTLVPSQHAIHELLIATVEYDGIEFDCYGVQYHGQAPELIQIALRGSTIDLSYMIDGEVFKALQAQLERDWNSK